jgi:hypothetical protein
MPSLPGAPWISYHSHLHQNIRSKSNHQMVVCRCNSCSTFVWRLINLCRWQSYWW